MSARRERSTEAGRGYLSTGDLSPDPVRREWKFIEALSIRHPIDMLGCVSSKTPPSDGEIYKRALAVAGVGLGLVALAVGTGASTGARAMLAHLSLPDLPLAVAAPQAAEVLSARPLDEALRAKGFHECNPHDPIGLGPYTPYKNLNVGRIAIPQKGGHTASMGYDVVIHFHGHSAVRKTLVQVSRGVAYVGIDKGLGSGPYSQAFANSAVYPALLRSIESALKLHTRDEATHVRKVVLSAWSAGYGAVNEILKHGDERVDAVVLLDGLHAAWNPARAKRDGTVASLSSHSLAPTFDFAKKALRGEKLFFFTHTNVNPETYPSTRMTADLLLHELGLERSPVDPRGDKFGQSGTVDRGGFHLWSYNGTDERAHCSHIPLIAKALAQIEAQWQTPAMDRTVPFTPAPKLGGAGDAEEPTAGLIELTSADEPELGGREGLEAVQRGGAEAPEAELLPKPAPAPGDVPAAPRPEPPLDDGAE